MLETYRLNKDFIPKEYYIKKKTETKDALKRFIIIMVIGNFILMPISIEILRNWLNDEKVNRVETTNVYRGSSKKDINKWIDCINDEIIKEAYINENEAYIKINNIDDYYNGYLKDKLTVVSIDNNDELYTLGVELNE